MPKKPAPFNNPFTCLKLEAKPAPSPKRAPAPVPSARPARVDDDTALFLESVGEVAPVKVKVERVAPAAAPPRRPFEDEAESLARLAELVSGEATFELSGDEAFVEGAVQGFDERVRKKLRRGDFRSAGSLDLHGLTRDEAKRALERFIADAKVAGHRCVRVVTGRGLHSEGERPVLKHEVPAWLTRGRAGRQVLAFCSARPEDGGDGALYVLLRR